MADALPQTMVTQLESLGTSLVRLARQQRDAPLATMEADVLEAIRQALPGLLQETLKISTTALQPAQSARSQPCPHCGRRTKAQSWRKRQLATVCGTISLERQWFVCGHCQQGFSPVDQTLQLQARSRLSEGLQGWVIGLGATMSFAEAASWLGKLTGIGLSAETVRQRTEGRGCELEQEQERCTEQVSDTGQPAGPVEPAPGVLVVETDGVMVRYLDGWHEVKLGVVGGHQEGRMVQASYTAARASVQMFGPRLLAEAARRGALEIVGWEGSPTQPNLAVLRQVVMLGDGAGWIWNLAAEHFGERIEIVDFYHACEHIWTVARALFGEGSPAAKDWADQRIGQLLAQGAPPVLKALAQAKGQSPEVAEVLRVERGYFSTNAARMDYPSFRARGLPIGSGAVESSAKRLVQQRLKLAGARWSQPGAQAVLNVRSRILSHLPLAA